MQAHIHPPRVVVLMSTYQGAPYVAEQLRSILDQLPPSGRVLVRDDGSRDGTAAIVDGLADLRVHVQRGANLGFAHSFLTLLSQAPADADLVMFADQDDVWLPGKIERAWQHLQPLGAVPALYGSAQMLVDAQLQPLRATPPWPGLPSFAGALLENMITGCTAALNRPALRLVQRAGVPPRVRFHDWWLYLVVSAFGRVVIDDRPTLLYRQHGRNLIGHGAGWLGRQRQIVRFLLRNDWVGILLAQVAELMRCYGAELAPQHRRLVEAHFRQTEGRWSPAWPLVFSLRRWHHSVLGEVALRLLLALHRLRLWPLPGRRLQ
ncbi:MAG: glycosyltransferase [Rubrivivax sp.]|jgi:glycosyltransferase involved in cell wall biosynthesis